MRLAFIAALVSGLLGAATLPTPKVAEAAQDLTIGSTVVVTGTDGAGLRLRSGPGLSHKVILTLREGERVQVLDGPVEDASQDWYQVKTSSTKGWSLGKYLASTDRGSRPSGAGPGRTFDAKISTYSTGDPGVGRYTATGTQVRFGTVAVDPNFIPFGSLLTISGFEGTTFVAEDRGGAVRGAHIDVYMPDRTASGKFGTQQRKVTVIREGYGR